MAKATNKTRETDADVEAFIATVGDQRKWIPACTGIQPTKSIIAKTLLSLANIIPR